MDGKHLPNDETPTRIEIHKAIMQMKNNKSPGMDDISAEMLKAGENCVLEMLHTLFQQIWAEKSVPAEWKDARLYRFTKKAVKTDVRTTEGYLCYQYQAKSWRE